MRSIVLILFCIIAIPAVAAQVAPRSAVAYVGYDYATKHHLVGVGARLDLPLPGRYAIQPSAEIQIIGDDASELAGSTRVQGSLDLIAEVPTAVVTPYLGAGLALFYRDSDRFSADGGVGGNLFAGVSLGRESGLRPFVQVRYSALDILEDSAVSWTGGVALGL